MSDFKISQEDMFSLLGEDKPEKLAAVLSDKPLVVVSAGAGTGKTHTLARRFAWLLASDPSCRVEQILTLTFTQLAAIEMRERIRKTIAEWLLKAGDKLPHLRDAYERIDESYISTIHSFALRVVRESGLSLDIDLGAGMASEPMEREFWTDFAWNLQTLNVNRICRGLDQVWRERAATLLNDRACLRLISAYSPQNLAKLAQAVGELHGSMNARPEDLWDFDVARERELKLRITESLDPEWRSVWNEWRYTVLGGINWAAYGKKPTNMETALRGLIDRWSDVPPDSYTPQLGRDFYIDLLRDGIGRIPGSSGLKNEIEELLGKQLTLWRNKERKRVMVLSESLIGEPGYSEEEAFTRALLLKISALGWACWEQARTKNGVLSFADLIRHAGSALRNDPNYAGRFRHIMIDEFQDTDGLQESLAASMRRVPAPGEHRSFFVVGDIKQSIYGFRHANPRLFARYINEAGGPDENSERIRLSASYRTNGRLMGEINSVFSHIWREGIIRGEGGDAASYEPLEPPEDAPWWQERNEPSAGSPMLEIMVGMLPEKEEKVAIHPRRQAMAHALAARLKELKETTQVWERGAFRPARWSDVAVLVPTRRQYGPLEEAFENASIPAAFGGGTEYFSRGEVRDLVNLLYVLDSQDDFALVGWMESPFSLLKPGTGTRLLTLSRNGGRPLVDLLREEHPESLTRLLTMRRRALIVSPSSALLSLLEDLSWLASYRSESRGKVLANVRRGIDIARSYEATFGAGLAGCADYLGRSLREGAPVEEASSESEDALAVMTIHASKGLEFPIVALVGMEVSLKKEMSRSKLSASRTLGVVATNYPVLNRGDDPEQDEVPGITPLWHTFAAERELTEEKERLLYVAMTRAKERLICCGLQGKQEEDEMPLTWLEAIMAASAANPEGERFPVTWVAPKIESTPPPQEKKAAAREQEQEAQLIPLTAWTPPHLRRLSASAFSLFEWCRHAYRMRYRQGRELSWELESNPGEGEGYGGAEMGSLAHWLLRRWNFQAAELKNLLLPQGERQEIETALRALPPFLRPVFASGGVRRALYSWLDVFASSPHSEEFRAAEQAGILQKEVSFRVNIPGVQLIGGMDAYWEDEEGRHVRDWKITPRSSAPDLMYRSQIEFYALACHKAKSGVPTDVKLIYLRPEDSSHEATLVDDWQGLERRVREAAVIAASGPFPAYTERCAECPFREPCQEAKKVELC